MKFDIERDNQLIATGEYFWCDSCAVARPIAERSSDPRYCRRCHNIIRAEDRRHAADGGCWRGDKYIISGQPFTVGHRVEPPAPPTETSREVVSKIVGKGIALPTPPAHRGRPRKEGEVSRITEWRRRREESQGVLAL